MIRNEMLSFIMSKIKSVAAKMGLDNICDVYDIYEETTQCIMNAIKDDLYY